MITGSTLRLSKQTNNIFNLKSNNNVLFVCLFSSKHFFSHVGTEPPLRTFLGVNVSLLKDTTRRR